jgi:hypothetical protein
MEPEQLLKLIGHKLTKRQLDKLEVFDQDYYKCLECEQDAVNIGYDHGLFLCCWCNNGCNTHGDINLRSIRKVPRKVKEYLVSIRYLLDD